MNSKIKLIHGDGGKYTNELIKEIFYKNFDNELLINSFDSSVFTLDKQRIAFTTDSYVIKPLFFPGGNIGKLAVDGTVNDLAVSGAKPLYLSCGFIIEEGFKVNKLNTIVKSMADESKKIGVKIVTGDTKVVEKGSIDGLFINTSGIGIIENNYQTKKIEEGDKIIITGNIAEHGTALAVSRYDLKVKGDFKSDCDAIYDIIKSLSSYMDYIKLMKDPTRGGVATILNEISEDFDLGIKIFEEKIPIRTHVKSVNDMLGLDPLYLANEGKIILVVDKKASKEVLEKIKGKGCIEANIIGEVIKTPKLVYMETLLGGKRILDSLDSDLLPRIC
ncbi:MAG: hydrogenase expression/formation protein HypE [Firmicutes bacterium]|nr:hydrogenase expression/formation protein HypE [Bacillota bacterium]